jgi:hypothetical protein
MSGSGNLRDNQTIYESFKKATLKNNMETSDNILLSINICLVFTVAYFSGFYKIKTQ